MNYTCLISRNPDNTRIFPSESTPQDPDLNIFSDPHIFRADGHVTRASGSPEIQHFHALLCKEFKAGEIEPIEVLERELATGNFILTTVFAPVDNPTMISGAYGSVAHLGSQSGAYGSIVDLDGQDGVLAIRFTLTEIASRGSGVSQVADRLLVNEAINFFSEKGKNLRCLIAEAVERSEHYWNTIGVSPDEGMKRIYGELPSGELQEISYSIPPLDWSPNGSPIGDGIEEHLMILWRGSPDQVLVDDLKNVLKVWWQQWYLRPAEDFESFGSHQNHVKFVEAFLNKNVIAPLSQFVRLRLLSRDEREQLQSAGVTIKERVIN